MEYHGEETRSMVERRAIEIHMSRNICPISSIQIQGSLDKRFLMSELDCPALYYTLKNAATRQGNVCAAS
jgi:hypothetical protein